MQIQQFSEEIFAQNVFSPRVTAWAHVDAFSIDKRGGIIKHIIFLRDLAKKLVPIPRDHIDTPTWTIISLND